MGLERLSFIYGHSTDFNIRQLWDEMAEGDLALENPDNARILRWGDQGDEGECYEASRTDLEGYLQTHKKVSFQFWHKGSGDDIFCTIESFCGDYVREYFNILGVAYSSEMKETVTKTLVRRAVRKAKRNSLLLFTYNPSGCAEEVDFDAVAQGSVDALKIAPEILGVPELTARRIRPRMAKEGFREHRVDSTIFFFSDSLPGEALEDL